MNPEFTRMSPKVNSRHECFKRSQIQQKLLAPEALRSKRSPVFSDKLDAIVPLEQRRTISSKWYTTICLPVVFQEIRKTSSEDDNAGSHTSAQTTAFLNTQNIHLMSHPPCSPDLPPNDFFLFPYAKNKMRGHRFSTPEEAVDAFRMHILEIPQSEWQKFRQLGQTHEKVYRY